MPSNHNVHRDIEVQSSEPAMTLLKIEPLETTFGGNLLEIQTISKPCLAEFLIRRFYSGFGVLSYRKKGRYSFSSGREELKECYLWSKSILWDHE